MGPESAEWTRAYVFGRTFGRGGEAGLRHGIEARAARDRLWERIAALETPAPP